MNFEIKEIVDKVVSNNISLEEFCILYLMYEKDFETLDKLDNYCRNSRYVLLYQKLFREQWITLTTGEENEIFKLTEKSINLLENN